MVTKLKFESMDGQKELKIEVKEQSLPELLAKPSKIEWILNKFTKKSERLIGIEESE